MSRSAAPSFRATKLEIPAKKPLAASCGASRAFLLLVGMNNLPGKLEVGDVYGKRSTFLRGCSCGSGRANRPRPRRRIRAQASSAFGPTESVLGDDGVDRGPHDHHR